ncbi:MAG: flagellar hook-associated protein FlgL [Desulfobacteraceae bacterium]|nr:flagellar hook-associated protein FlgL [Desulfobacteraceae bacterium]MDH3836186.1 flagellar hook-associated protein FlgL [Desulfobacteraceae bacterium]MDH3873921.1 flagellar hook-associated protein FlgL [Desulfobacteraceae bacterium]MDH3882297.1 flagellar hook-associated protein FlgL [Desulfobacteraceae bacterium]
MRVANKAIYDSVKYNLGSISEELNKANEIVTTGKRINNLSDDPVGLTQSLNIRSTLSSIEQMGRNISYGNSWLTVSENALTSVQNIIADTKVLCIQMANATIGSDQRSSAAGTVQNMLDEIVSLGNTDVAGNYIFAGSKTDTIPFDQDGTYNGDNNPFAIKISKNSTVEVGSDGGAVFGNIFNSLSDLKTALETNDLTGIQDAMGYLDGHFEDMSAKISDIGSKMNRMEIKDKIYQDLNFSNTERLSKIEDADIAEAIMNVSAAELTYQAALASSSKVMKLLTLVDYLK